MATPRRTSETTVPGSVGPRFCTPLEQLGRLDGIELEHSSAMVALGLRRYIGEEGVDVANVVAQSYEVTADYSGCGKRSSQQERRVAIVNCPEKAQRCAGCILNIVDNSDVEQIMSDRPQRVVDNPIFV